MSDSIDPPELVDLESVVQAGPPEQPPSGQSTDYPSSTADSQPESRETNHSLGSQGSGDVERPSEPEISVTLNSTAENESQVNATKETNHTESELQTSPTPEPTILKPKSPTPQDVTTDELSPARKAAMGQLHKALQTIQLTDSARKQLPEDLTPFYDQLAKEIEKYVYLHFGETKTTTGTAEAAAHTKGVGAAYRTKIITLIGILKDATNKKFHEMLLLGQISPEKVVLTPKNEILLFNPEIRQLEEKIMEESLQQSILKDDNPEGVRIKRTHKGDEIIETNDYNFEHDSEIDFSTVRGKGFSNSAKRARRSSDRDGDKDSNEPRRASGSGPGRKTSLPTVAVDEDSDDDVVLSSNIQNLLDDDDLRDLVTNQTEKATAGTVEAGVNLEELGAADVAETIVVKQVIDPSNIPRIWEGTTNMPGIAACPTEVYLMNDAWEFLEIDPARNIYRNDLFQADKDIRIEGRVDKAAAVDYLESKQSTSRMVVVQIAPNCVGLSNYNAKKARESFATLFSYFYDRNKYGIISTKGPIVRDAYLIALKKKYRYLIPRVLKNAVNKEIWKVMFDHCDEVLLGLFLIPENLIEDHLKTVLAKGDSKKSSTDAGTAKETNVQASTPGISLRSDNETLKRLKRLGLSSTEIESLKELLFKNPNLVPLVEQNPDLLVTALRMTK